MKTGKFQKHSRSGKAVVLVLTMVLLMCVAIGGTIAWLTAQTHTVTNTFTVGDINIQLWEHELNDEGNGLTAETVANEDSYKVLPGTKQLKDPFVIVEAESEDCYVFVQVQEVNNVAEKDTAGNITHKYVTWEIDGNVWTELAQNADGTVTTYYATTNYTTQDTDKEYNVLKDTEVTYGEALTKAMLEKVTDDNKPALIFKAFAVQEASVDTAAEAWAKIDAAEKLS